MDLEVPSALAPGVAPPARIEVGELLLRAWRPEDLVPRFEAVADSFDHLHPWMDWLAEPTTLDRQREWDRARGHGWPSDDRGFHYGVFAPDGLLLGAMSLHDRLGPPAMEIGYWCRAGHTGRGVITRCADALTRITLSLPGIERVEIHCDAANLRSAAVPRRLGYELDRVEPRPRRAPAESGRGMCWIKRRTLGPHGPDSGTVEG
ncbi:GNAT family N-acetyltransferase [Nocardia sp. NPDC003482]